MIESYDFGFMVIQGKQYTSDCIVTEDAVDATWLRRKGHELAIEDIRETVDNENLQTIVIGTGKYGMMKILSETVQYLQEKNIEIVAGNTDAAVKRFNDLETRKNVVGFFHLTC